MSSLWDSQQPLRMWAPWKHSRLRRLSTCCSELQSVWISVWMSYLILRKEHKLRVFENWVLGWIVVLVTNYYKSVHNSEENGLAI
jgi:hypothetical protein